MPSSPSATPTPLTPPRVPLIDSRTGLIDRAWYMFFLSLFQTAQNAEDPTLGPSAESLVASYDEALRQLSQFAETLPPAVDYTNEINEIKRAGDTQPSNEVGELQQQTDIVRQELQILPAPAVTELQQQVDTLRQEVQTAARPELGTFAALQQANLSWTTFDTSPQSTPTDVGTLAWDGGTTLGLQATTSVLMELGESEYVYVKASSAITKGQLCYHTGAVGSSGVITAAPTPLALTDPNQLVGVAAESIALNSFGLIQISGPLRGFNTTGSSVGEVWADGDPLYYNPAYVGGLTKTKPSAPNQKSYIGEVINAGSGGSGSINIRIVPGSTLGGTDSNVQFGTLANNDLIQYDSALGYWKNVAATSIVVGITTDLSGGATGSLPYQSAVDNTTFLPIGTASQVLKVNAGATAPEWVSGAALTKVDDTNVTLTLGGTPATSLLAATSLTLGWTGQLATGRGGTGTATTFTAGSIVFAGASGVYSQNNSSLFWDNTNGRFGVQTATPNTWMTVRMSHTPPSATAYTSGIQIHDEPNGVAPHWNAGVAYDGGANYGWIQVNSSGGAYNLVLQLAGGNTYIGAKTSYFGAKAAIIAPGSQYGLELQSNTVGYYAGIVTNTATSGDNYFIYFGTEADGATQRGSITYNRAGGLTAYNTTSDYRAKDILGPLENSGQVIDQLKVYNGRMKGAEISRPMLVAHEAQEVTPYAVTGAKDEVDAEGNPVFQQMDHSSYVPLILAELQQLRKRVAELESQK